MLEVARHLESARPDGCETNDGRAGGVALFWGRSDTHLAGDEAPLVTDAHADESLAE